MPNNSAISSDPTLTKLLEVDAELATQEAELLAQLQTLQEKRKSLQIVLGLFAPQEQAATVAAAPAPASSNGQAPEAAEVVAATPEPAPESAEAADDQEAATPEPVEAAAEDQQEAPSPRRRRATSTKQQPNTTKQRSQDKQKAPAKAGSRKESWRPYVREDFPPDAPLAELAAAVMQRLPERSFTVPEIMGSIFTEDIPQSQYDTAKGRLFTVLSNGVKDNLWVRPDKGQYSAPTK